MIAVEESPKNFIICQSCNRDHQKLWKVTVSTVLGEAFRQGTVVTLCTQCLLVLGVKIYNATKEEKPDAQPTG